MASRDDSGNFLAPHAELAICKTNPFASIAQAGVGHIRQGIVPNLAGFDYYYRPNFPTNSEFLGGVAVHQSAIGVAMAPVQPAPGVRSQLVAFDVAVDLETGIALDYRAWGQPETDRDFHIIECSYGYATINLDALKRMTTA